MLKKMDSIVKIKILKVQEVRTVKINSIIVSTYTRVVIFPLVINAVSWRRLAETSFNISTTYDLWYRVSVLMVFFGDHKQLECLISC